VVLAKDHLVKASELVSKRLSSQMLLEETSFSTVTKSLLLLIKVELEVLGTKELEVYLETTSNLRMS